MEETAKVLGIPLSVGLSQTLFLGVGLPTASVTSLAVFMSYLAYKMFIIHNDYQDNRLFGRFGRRKYYMNTFSEIKSYRNFDFSLFGRTTLGKAIKYETFDYLFITLDLILSDKESNSTLAKVQTIVESEQFQETDSKLQEDYLNQELQPVLLQALLTLDSLMMSSPKARKHAKEVYTLNVNVTNQDYEENEENEELHSHLSTLEAKNLIRITSEETNRMIRFYDTTKNILFLKDLKDGEIFSTSTVLRNLEEVYPVKVISGFQNLEEIQKSQNQLLL